MDYSEETTAKSFAKIFSGHFTNKQQANKYPKDFAHINIFVRPLEFKLFDSLSFYSEQSYDHSPWSPYRQAVQKINIKKGLIILETYNLKNHKRVAGAGFNFELINYINRDDLIPRFGCEMHFIEHKKGHYRGSLRPGKTCFINREGQETYLLSKVEINKKKWVSIDEGYDIQTDKKVWGSENGPYEFLRVEE